LTEIVISVFTTDCRLACKRTCRGIGDGLAHLYIPYRPFAFPQEENLLEYNYFLPIRTFNVSILELLLVVRLLVRCVTGFDKNCPHLLSACLWKMPNNKNG
jgi:hypothetical protein